MCFQLRLGGWSAFFLTITVAQVFSQVHNSMQDRSFSSSSLTIMYRLFVPENYDNRYRVCPVIAVSQH